jgi:hypothetical protein
MRLKITLVGWQDLLVSGHMSDSSWNQFFVSIYEDHTSLLGGGGSLLFILSLPAPLIYEVPKYTVKLYVSYQFFAGLLRGAPGNVNHAIPRY